MLAVHPVLAIRHSVHSHNCLIPNASSLIELFLCQMVQNPALYKQSTGYAQQK